MEVLTLIFLLWAWDGKLWEKVDPEPEELEELVIPENAVDITQVTQTAAALTAVGEALTGTSTSTSTAEIEAQIIEELENMDETTTTVPTSTTVTGSSTSTTTSTGT